MWNTESDPALKVLNLVPSFAGLVQIVVGQFPVIEANLAILSSIFWGAHQIRGKTRKGILLRLFFWHFKYFEPLPGLNFVLGPSLWQDLDTERGGRATFFGLVLFLFILCFFTKTFFVIS